MKKILIGMLVFGSISSQANILSPQSNEDVLNEIVLSLHKNDLDCTEYKTPSTKLRASELGIRRVFGKEFTLTVNRGGQPVISLLKKQDVKTTASMEVTTDSAYKNVTKLNIRRFTKNAPRRQRVNIGTIIDPLYEEVVTEIADTVLESIICK